MQFRIKSIIAKRLCRFLEKDLNPISLMTSGVELMKNDSMKRLFLK